MPAKKAAIPADEILSRSLSEISAADFLTLMTRDDLIDRSALTLLPDKKKYELWVDEDVVFKIPIGEIATRLKSEKLKMELELPDVLLDKWRVERHIDPDRFTIPDPREVAIENLARQAGRRG